MQKKKNNNNTFRTVLIELLELMHTVTRNTVVVEMRKICNVFNFCASPKSWSTKIKRIPYKNEKLNILARNDTVWVTHKLKKNTKSNDVH